MKMTDSRFNENINDWCCELEDLPSVMKPKNFLNLENMELCLVVMRREKGLWKDRK